MGRGGFQLFSLSELDLGERVFASTPTRAKLFPLRNFGQRVFACGPTRAKLFSLRNLGRESLLVFVDLRVQSCFPPSEFGESLLLVD